MLNKNKNESSVLVYVFNGDELVFTRVSKQACEYNLLAVRIMPSLTARKVDNESETLIILVSHFHKTRVCVQKVCSLFS